MFWSDRFNWSDDQVPTGTGTLTFPVMASTTQDVFNATGGTPNSSFSGIDAPAGASIFGYPLGLADAARVVGPVYLDARLITAGALHLDATTSRALTVQSIVQQPGVITDVTIGSDEAHAGDVFLYTPAHTGSTTIRRGSIWFGVLGFHVNTHDQSDYRIDAGASLYGNGTIGLAAGKHVDNGGTISTSGDGPDAFLTFDGDLRMEVGATFYPQVYLTAGSQPMVVPINVTGTMDLSAASDTLYLGSLHLPTLPASYVLSDYGSRICEFDNVVGLQPWMSIVYTSAPNAGAGQVLLQVVPEPHAVLTVTVTATVLCRVRKRPIMSAGSARKSCCAA